MNQPTPVSSFRRFSGLSLAILLFSGVSFADSALQLHLPLDGDARVESVGGGSALVHGVDFVQSDWAGQRPVADFNGRNGWLEIDPPLKSPLGGGDFTVSGWFRIPEKIDDLSGDLLSQYDPATRKGWILSLQHAPGVTTHQSNARNLFFGLDDGQSAYDWKDRGQPGNATLVYALTVFEGNLYAGTYEGGEGEAGSVYRFNGEDGWEFCGNPDVCNSVTSLCVFEGSLYAAVSRYQASGSKLDISSNQKEGGKVYRYKGGTEWADCGRVGDAEYIFGMTEFDGALYATLIHAPNPSGDMTDLGLYRYEGGKKWTYCDHPGGRPVALSPYNGNLYASGYDGPEFGGVFRYEGDSRWTNLGAPGKTTQTYSFAYLEGMMYVGTWPEGKVYRLESDESWKDCGQLGEEQEVMGMTVYNGRLLAGTLPLAQVYQYEGGENWSLTGRLDHTEGEMYRRAWSMAVHGGQLFCGVLPSGHVHSLQIGHTVSHDSDLGTGWKHVAAVREGAKLTIYVDGEAVASREFEGPPLDVTTSAPLKIGFGPHEYFKGQAAEIRIHSRALSNEELKSLSSARTE